MGKKKKNKKARAKRREKAQQKKQKVKPRSPEPKSKISKEMLSTLTRYYIVFKIKFLGYGTLLPLRYSLRSTTGTRRKAQGTRSSALSLKPCA